MIPADAYEGVELCDVCGRESCEDHLPPDPAHPQPARPALRFQSAAGIISEPAPDPIVEGAVWENCLTVLAAESGAGKTFVQIDLSAAVSAGTPWHGRDTQQGAVAYVSYEGDALNLRFRAARDIRGHRLEHVYVLRAHEPLSPRVTHDGEACSPGERALTTQLELLAADLTTRSLPPIRLVVIDTVRASLSGSEDSSEHVSAYLRAVRRCMAVVPGAGVLLAHHAGWQDGDTQRKRERGSSAWRGNVDATLYLEAGEYDRERGEAPLTLRALKVRDGERPAPLHLIRRRVDLAVFDRRGRPLDSCIIEPDRRTHQDIEAERVATLDAQFAETDRRVLQAMRDYPAATSITRLRPYVGLRTGIVTDAVARLLRAGHVAEGRRGEPYTVTPSGLALLAGSTP
ncbi:MAG: AAA family ATPase [Acidobacteria bacterium]|nr:AAA family ATPase [Acidobacteriota bacterium]